MALQTRHLYVARRVDEALGIGSLALTEELLKERDALDVLNHFFSAKGPPRVLIYYLNPEEARARGCCVSRPAKAFDIPAALLKAVQDRRHSNANNNDGDIDISGSNAKRRASRDRGSGGRKRNSFQGGLLGMPGEDPDDEDLGCLVVNTDAKHPPKPFLFLHKDAGVELDPGRSHDGQLTFGRVTDPLPTLEALVRHLYGPLIKEQNATEWGKTPPERRKEFMVGVDVLSHNLHEALKTLSAGLQLARPNPRLEAMGAAAVMENSSIMAELLDLFDDWCTKIEAYLEDGERARWETNDAGPDSELDYWRRRMQRLTSISEQLRTPQCQLVVYCLSTVARQPPDGVMDRERMISLLKRWKTIELGITEALSEAKDNMKYLGTLERFMEPLYSGQPLAILDCLPAMLNAIKMIHTISRYYNTTPRMTKLFMKITNQMVCTCKTAINGNDACERIWRQDPSKLLSTLELCLRLNEQYQEQYRLVKEKLVTMPKGKQFDFSETQIFGKFDLFCRRVIKLIDLFSTMEQFRLIGQSSFEGVEGLIARFNTTIELLRIKGHDLLDYHNNKFDRDYVDFNGSMEVLEGELQQYINASFDRCTSIRESLLLLRKFQDVLHRENLRVNLESKFALIFHSYGEELERVQDTYERHRHNPPLARNMPPVVGNILWARNLMQRIEEPMKTFQAYPSLTGLRDSRKVIKTYNKVAKTLVAFELVWYDAWVKSVDAARAGLQATLIIRDPTTGQVFVNLDHEIVQLIQEAKHLTRLGLDLPERARMVLMQEDKYKRVADNLIDTLRQYGAVTNKVYKVVARLLVPAVQTLDVALRPGLVTLTWTSVNIESFRTTVHKAIGRLDDLVNKINDIVDNRIAKNLKLISNMVLVDFPSAHAVTLDEFVVMQERAVRSSSATLVAKNMEVEAAVEDLIGLVKAYPIHSSVTPYPEEEERVLRQHFRALTQVALLRCNQLSFDTMQKRICARLVNGVFVIDRPFFDLDVQLAVPSVRLNPSLDDVQSAINRAAVAVLEASKKVRDWGQANVPDKQRKTFFDILGKDLGIIKVCLRLTGALFTTRRHVAQYLSTFQRYDWLWRDDKEAEYRKFLAKHNDEPDMGAFEAELIKYREIEADIDHIPPTYVIGALSLNTNNLRLQLKAEARMWQFTYASKLHAQAKERMSSLLEYIRVTTNKLSREVNSLDSLRYVMVVLREIRERETTIEIEIAPILDMYRLLEAYVPGTLVDKEEMDQKSIIRHNWRKLVEFAETITDNLSLVQGVYKKKLLADTREFRVDVKQFRADFEENGPMMQGIDPMEAVERLRRFKEDLAVRERKMEMYKAGEDLFALQQSQYPELIKSRKEVSLLDQLYSLYVEVINSYETYKKCPWPEVLDQLKDMQTAADSFDNRCKRLPKKLKEWEAYLVLRKTITDLQDFLPLFEQLSKPSIKPRHWHEVIHITGTPYPYDKDHFRVENLIASPLLQHKELVEEVCEGADKQLDIETKFMQVVEQWALARFDFTVWKGRDIPILRAFGLVIEQLDESQLGLQSLLGMRHVTPFKDRVQAKLTELSDTADTLELWVKVQLLWTSLESVFMGGDIAKQMPQDAKKFMKIDKDWAKLMARSLETALVVPCCGNELLRNTLPVLYSELEKCQKSLEGYLEQKRTRFPRFYFVSNPVLLLILSQGSDPMQMQPYYEKVFDSINRVVHDRLDRCRITAIKSMEGSDEESIALVQDVVASNTNIEDWLGHLERMMQRSLKALCERAAFQCSHMPLRDYVDSNCGQFALLGVQFNWTAQCQEALDKCKANKHIMADTLKVQNNVLTELSSWCLTDLGSRMNRVKIETLITIHVHQRDVFTDITRLYKERKISDAGDFEWSKQARFYWSPNKGDMHGPGACIVSICDIDFKYCFEYLGCKERLVITPLTDRCYITLSQALGMYLGGAPAGPAGTGKTETVKDLGRALGIFVVVTNCTDQQRYTDLAKIFKGLCQGGLWGCFDEFNRIELPVLSVVAQQVLAITNAKRTAAPTFTFPGDSQLISLNPNVGYFITMNPGYQGRQELPENLKVLFRSVSMMVPDREIIMKVKLCSVGYQGFGELARKFNVLYRLCEQQLSKQKHYDFGLRNILSVLRTAGKTKRDNSRAPEEALLMRTLRDMNLSKLVAQDVPLFLSLLSDLFPLGGTTVVANDSNAEVERALEASLVKTKLVSHRSWNIKIIQLYETTLVRHGVMVVGPAGSGKSSIIQTLQDSLTSVQGVPYKRIRMNPKAIRAEEMFGETDKLSGEWLDGVFAAMWAKYNDRSRKDMQWIICDGPIDAIWIENLNTVLDDNKILTLANGDRIPMTDNVKLMFEVEDLRNASPATVSRAGIIFVSNTDLDWSPVMEAWLLSRPEPQADLLRTFVGRYLGRCDGNKDVGHMFAFLSKKCSLVVKTARVHLVESLIRLLTGLLTGASLSDSLSDLSDEMERIFIFALTWALGGLLEAEDRAALDLFVRGLGPTRLMPPSNAAQSTIYDFRFNMETLDWERWSPPRWEYPRHSAEPNYASLLVPTVDTTRSLFLLHHLVHKQRRPVLLAGGSGTAKTSTALMFFDSVLGNDKMLLKKINFSSATSAGMLQRTVEGELDKRGGKNFGPPNGKKMTLFLDDLNMPEVNLWGDQPTLEVIRQLMEQGNVAFLDKDKRGDLKVIEDLQYVGAMNHPGAGKNDIPNRLKRHFFMFNLILPSVQSINDIYGRILGGRFPANEHPTAFVNIANALPDATIRLWNWTRVKMLPSPSKFHYVFNLRELSRVFQGVLHTPKDTLQNSELRLIKLWRHECERVFADKLTTLADKKAFNAQLCAQVLTLMQPMLDAVKATMPRNVNPVDLQNAQAAEGSKGTAEAFFVDFLRDDIYDEDGVLVQAAPKLYELGGSLTELRERVQMFLARHNEERPAQRMNLVLFDDAMRHLMRITRCLGMPRGNMLLVGVGGSGKQSLTRLASYISGNETFQITLTKSYNLNALMDDVRLLYKSCGQEGRPMTFIFTEADVKDEQFLEVLNSILMTGEVTNLFQKDEFQVMAADLRTFAFKENPHFQDTPENLVRCFIDRVRANLHLILCMSPVSAKFPERARKFPGLINGCSIDWFLPWPEEALVAVSEGFIQHMAMTNSGDVRQQLIVHMGMVHRLVMDSCDEYFQKMRRNVYQTPRSFLSFLRDYQCMYEAKVGEIDRKASSVVIGLDKLRKGAEDVEAMKLVLAEEEVKLRRAEEASNVMLKKLEISSMEAKKEADAVARIKELCEADAKRIEGEKHDAEEDLAKAQPFVDEAEHAVNSIKPPDLNELKQLKKPSDIIKLIFDCVGILKMEKLVKVEMAEVTLGIGKDKATFSFVRDSFKGLQTGMLSDARFLQSIFYFSKYEKDLINDETVELLLPYLELDGFTAIVARNASKAAEGLCTWCRAMVSYHEASKIVKPKLEALKMAQARLDVAQMELYKAEQKLQACQDVMAKLQADFEAQMAQKRAIEENALNTKKRMQKATALIDGLAGERRRWTSDSMKFADTKKRLIGDVALACAFISYCGPFNQTFRDYLIREKLAKDLRDRNVPVTEGINLTNFLVDVGTVGDWSLEGLPTDPLSIQNGILVTRSSRYPLLIDPQGQALAWIKNHESSRLPAFGVTTFGNAKFRDQLEFALQEGKALIVSGIEQELDPLISPVLEKQVVTKGKSKYVNIASKMCEYNDSFKMYLTTRLPNPHFSPEDQAKTTMVDFTVTQKGLEEQLLGRVIQKEQKSLEEQLKNVLADVTSNTKALLRLDELLLERLSANTGNLLDDEELISVLAVTKAKSTEVNEKLLASGEMRRNIDEKREQYRPVATRGSLLYFAIVDMSLVNVMYQTSLDQFQQLFDRSMDVAERANLPSKRVNNIVEAMTYLTYRYINRGLYERDKVSFKLIVLLKILLTAGRLQGDDVTLLLKGAAALDLSTVKPKPFRWLSDNAWLNVLQLSAACQMFKNLVEDVTRNEGPWKAWYGDNEPEALSIPVYEPMLTSDRSGSGPFLRLLVVRMLREDRTLIAVNEFIRAMDVVDANGLKLAAMGPRYVEPVADTVDRLSQEINALSPVIFLLSAGADPTESVETLARKKKTEILCVSMGEGQERVASAAIATATINGSWVLLQNCHLGLAFMESMEELFAKIRESCSPAFRLFITTEPHPRFPIGLLQMSTKVTNEPPKGLRAGLLRSYSVMIDRDKLERLETIHWRKLLYTLCFLHSIVQERRKFGPLGWCVPYEYNDGDLNACTTFLEKHLYNGQLSWPTLQYMVGEVQYGGKITDDLDRRMFNTYTEAWLSPASLQPGLMFNPEKPVAKSTNDFKYVVPDFLELEDYHSYMRQFPDVDSPEIFGLHPNADLTFRYKEVAQLLNTILETQPKQSSADASGRTREDLVQEKCEELLSSMPEEYKEDQYLEQIAALGGLEIPLNIFLMQEVQRMQFVIDKVRSTLEMLLQAIRGEVVVTPEVIGAINCIYDARVPRGWLLSPGGDEISWMVSSLGLWYSGLNSRDAQFKTWLRGGRPLSYWLTGFFNPQGFLTAVQQEVTRGHKNDEWSLDSVSVATEVTEFLNPELIKAPPREGVFLHGLFLDGAGWDRPDRSLRESEPKKLFTPLPVMHVTAGMKGRGSKADSAGKGSDYGPYGGYECPVYKYPARTDRYLIFSVTLASREKKPSHWTLRGVALLCTTD